MSFPINMTGFMGGRPKGFPTDGLVAYWKMDSPSFLADSWNSHNASYGGLSIVEGKINQGLRYNVAESHFTIPHSTDFNFSDGTQNFSFSMGCWVNFDVDKDTWLFNKRTSGTDRLEWHFSYFSGNVRLQVFANDDTTQSIQYTFPFSPELGEWYNFIASHNAVTGESAIYINGTESAGTDSGVGGLFTIASSNLILGGAWGSGRSLNGILDEVWIKKHHHTTPEEALLIWNDGLGLTI